MAVHEGRIVVLDRCTIDDGDCWRHCPRTPTDVHELSEKARGVSFGAPEPGAILAVEMARSADAAVREKGQDGGVVTALLAFALDEGMVDSVVCSKKDAQGAPHGFVARTSREVQECAGSSYEAAFTLDAFRKIPSGNADRLAVAGVGCQMEALAKMKAAKPVNGGNPENVQLTIGLFCGWALKSDIFRPLLEEICDTSRIVKFDIPHSPGTSFDVYTEDAGKISVPLDDIRPAINPACQYCWDMTAEFSDISVGSAGSSFHGWNTVITRTGRGAELMKRAVAAGIIEVQSLPESRMIKLKESALNRKKNALRRLAQKSGSREDLGYISGLSAELVDYLLKD
jgi:coenzyme F420 hydrogenase subunit beta